MLDNITLGQYYPSDSVIHRLDPRTKLLFTLVYIVMLFVVNNLWGYLTALIGLTAIIILCKIPVKTILSGLKTIIFIILLTVILNLFMTPGTVIWSWKFLKITAEGVRNSIFMAFRLVLLIVGTNIMTLTTTPMDLTDGMEHGMRHVPFLGKYAHEMAMMMSIALRFIPTLIEETDKIMKAQKARGANFETGNLFNRAKALIPILVPLFISAFRRAEELATAMEARCYRGGENRTRLKVLVYQKRDYAALVIMLLFAVMMVATRWIQMPLPLLKI